MQAIQGVVRSTGTHALKRSVDPVFAFFFIVRLCGGAQVLCYILYAYIILQYHTVACTAETKRQHMRSTVAPSFLNYIHLSLFQSWH